MDNLQHLQMKKNEKKSDSADAWNRTQDQNFTKHSQHHKIKKNEENFFFDFTNPGNRTHDQTL